MLEESHMHEEEYSVANVVIEFKDKDKSIRLVRENG